MNHQLAIQSPFRHHETMREIKRPVFLIIAALIAFGLLGAAVVVSL